MIRMALNYKKDRIRPVFVCDHCGEEITDAHSANALYGDPGTTAILHVHKGCDAAFRSERASNGEPSLAWTTLSTFIAQLGYSSGLRKAEADRLSKSEAWGRRGREEVDTIADAESESGE